VYKREREVKGKAIAVLHDEINRIMNPSIMILTLFVSIIKEDIHNILLHLDNLRNTENIMEIIKKKILREVEVASHLLYREALEIGYSKLSQKFLDKKEYNKEFILFIHDGRMANNCQKIFDGESNIFSFVIK
jgi:hypothetical protein